MPSPYATEFQPEMGQEFLASRLGDIDKEEASQEGRAVSQASARGLSGQAAMGIMQQGARQWGSEQKDKTIADFNLDVAGKQREERLHSEWTGEAQAYQSSEAEKDRDLREKIANMGFAQQANMMRAGKIADQQGAVVGGAVGLAETGIMARAIFSDYVLKKNVKEVGRVGHLAVYDFEYRSAEHPGLSLPVGVQRGFMAQEVERFFPEAVSMSRGFKMVDYTYLAGVL